MADGRPYPSAGRFVRSWIQRSLVHGEGDVLGEPVRLATAWHRVIELIYQFDPTTGQLLRDRVVVIMGKGNIKTETIGELGLAEIDGPLAPISPNVPISAASWDNANRLFGAARLAILGDGAEHRGPLAARFRDGVHILEDRILLPEREGRLYRTAAVAGTNDGGLPSAYLGDELHEWQSERAERMWTVQGKSLRKRRVIRRLHPAISQALEAEMAARFPHVEWRIPALYGGLQIAISTPGADRNSLLGRLYDHGVAVANREVDDPGYLFMGWEADPSLDLEDPEQRRLAELQGNPTAGEAIRLESIEASFRDPTVPRSEFVRYNLSRWPDAETRWMAAATWDGSKGIVSLEAADPVYAAIAIAPDHRSAAIATAQRQGDRIAARVTRYPETPLPADELLAVSELDKAVAALRKSHPARVLAPRRLRPGGPERVLPTPGPEIVYNGGFFEGSAQRFRAEGAAVLDVPISPKSPERLRQAGDTLRSLAEQKLLVHEDDPELARQIGDVVERPGATGSYLMGRAGAPVIAAFAVMAAVHRAMTAPRPTTSTPVYGSFKS